MKNLSKTGFSTAIFALALIFAVTLFGCKDETPIKNNDNTGEVNDIPENSIKSIELEGYWKIDYVYEQEKLKSFVWDESDTFVATYEQDRITKLKTSTQEIRLTYDTDGRITEYIYESPPANFFRYEYEYTGSNEQPSAITFSRTYRESNGTYVEKVNIEKTNIQYNSEGGVVSCDRTYYDYGNNNTYYNEITFELEDKPNQLYGDIVYMTYPSFTDGLITLSKLSKQYVKGYTLKAPGASTGSEQNFEWQWDAGYPDYPSKFILYPGSSGGARIFTWNR